MKKRTIYGALAVVPLLLSSCVVYSEHYVTGNPVGTKVGYVKAKVKRDFAGGVAQAARNGQITEIGSVDVKCYAMGKVRVTVTGE